MKTSRKIQDGIGDIITDSELGIILLSRDDIEKLKKEAENKDLWNLKMVGAYEAQEISRGEGVTIAIINSGVDSNHPEISDRFGENKGINLVFWYYDNDGNLVVDEKGLPKVKEDYDPGIINDDNAHGTAIAGIVAGKTIGIAPESHLYVIKAVDEKGKLFANSIEKAIKLCIRGREKIDIINLSMGRIEYRRNLEKLCEEAYKKGTIIVASAGNYGVGPIFPSAYENVVCVGAVDKEKKHCKFSNIWHTVDLSAPGKKIFSCRPKLSSENNYDLAYATSTGTSFATPHVTGALALAISYLKSKGIRYAPTDLIKILKTSCEEINYEEEKIKQEMREHTFDKLEGMTPKKFIRWMYGAGILRIDKFLENVITYYKK